jgi:hypothetical protein
MAWRLNLCAEAEAELLAMPPDIRARFLHVADLLELRPHVTVYGN